MTLEGTYDSVFLGNSITFETISGVSVLTLATLVANETVVSSTTFVDVPFTSGNFQTPLPTFSERGVLECIRKLGRTTFSSLALGLNSL